MSRLEAGDKKKDMRNEPEEDDVDEAEEEEEEEPTNEPAAKRGRTNPTAASFSQSPSIRSGRTAAVRERSPPARGNASQRSSASSAAAVRERPPPARGNTRSQRSAPY